MQDDHTLPPTPGGSDPTPRTRDGVPAPTQIGPYRILQKISEGGMGEVFLAEQEEPIKRRVALKVIKAGMDTKQVVARFEVERQALALMDHPCIARVYDAGATEQGRPYFVMEYVPGIPITEYCDKHRLSIRDRLLLFIRVCEGVQHAHQKAIIHRDLKPSNILVFVQDERPIPKIIDFGVAKATGHELAERTMFTQLGQMIGTPEYMSPEQTEVGSDNVDTRADIYSLGAILYELLVGVLPFDPKDWRRAGFSEIQRRIREEEPSRPSTRLSTLKGFSEESALRRGTEPVRLRGIIRGDLDWITMKALEKDRTRRYETANGFAMDIRRYLNDEAVLATPPSAGYRLRKTARRHRGAFLVSGLLLVILVAATISSLTLYLRAERETARARTEAARSDQVAELMKTMLKGVGPSVARGRDTKLLREILDDTAKRLQGHLEDQPLVRAELESVLGATYRDLGEYQMAEQHLDAALALQRAAHGERSAPALEAASALGMVYYNLGRMEAADSLFTWTAKAQAEVLGPNDPATLATLSAQLGVLGYEGRLDEAAKLGEQILPPMMQSPGESSEVTQGAMYTLAQVYADQGNFARAESVYVPLLDILHRTVGNEHPQDMAARVGYGWMLRQAHRLPEAEQYTRGALTDMRRVLGNEHSETLVAVNNLGIILAELGRFEEAEPYYREGVETSTRVLGEKHPETVVSMVNLASFHMRAKHYKEGEAVATRCLEIFKETMPPDHIGTGIAFNVRADCRKYLGRLAEAQADYLASFAILSKHHELSHPRVQLLARNIAESYEKSGQPGLAAEWRAKLEPAAVAGE